MISAIRVQNNMKQTPLISVVIPSYKHGHLIGRAIQSVVDQSFSNWEAIIVDNHSVDNTDEVVIGFTDPRIKLLKIHNNGVIAASRNMGIRAASGQYVAFLDSDDWWKPEKLQACLDNITPDVNLVHHDLEIVGAKSFGIFIKKIKSRKLKPPVTVDLLINGNSVATSSVMVRRELLNNMGGMNESLMMSAAEDYHTWLLISQLPGLFKYVEKTLGYYLVHAHGVSQKDMSKPMLSAVSAFLPVLNHGQKNMVMGRIIYARARFLYLKGRRSWLTRHLCYCLKFGDFEIKLKAFAMILVIKTKKIIG